MRIIQTLFEKLAGGSQDIFPCLPGELSEHRIRLDEAFMSDLRISNLIVNDLNRLWSEVVINSCARLLNLLNVDLPIIMP